MSIKKSDSVSGESCSEEDSFDFHALCGEVRCYGCRCKFCGFRLSECRCSSMYQKPLLTKSCRGCNGKFELEKLYNLYLIEKNRLGDDNDKYDMKFTSLCRKCLDEAKTNEKKCAKKAILYDKHKAAWKKEVAASNKEVARLTEEITKLKEIEAMRSNDTAKLVAIPTGDNSMDMNIEQNDVQTVINDSVTKIMEACKTLTETRVYRDEEMHGSSGELKRKLYVGPEVVNNTSTGPVNTHNETKTMECTTCKGTKPLSSFQTKSHEKTKSGRIAEYLITRKMCRSCRDMKYKHAKKAKTS